MCHVSYYDRVAKAYEYSWFHLFFFFFTVQNTKHYHSCSGKFQSSKRNSFSSEKEIKKNIYTKSARYETTVQTFIKNLLRLNPLSIHWLEMMANTLLTEHATRS